MLSNLRHASETTERVDSFPIAPAETWTKEDIPRPETEWLERNVGDRGAHEVRALRQKGMLNQLPESASTTGVARASSAELVAHRVPRSSQTSDSRVQGATGPSLGLGVRLRSFGRPAKWPQLDQRTLASSELPARQARQRLTGRELSRPPYTPILCTESIYRAPNAATNASNTPASCISGVPVPRCPSVRAHPAK